MPGMYGVAEMADLYGKINIHGRLPHRRMLLGKRLLAALSPTFDFQLPISMQCQLENEV